MSGKRALSGNSVISSVLLTVAILFAAPVYAAEDATMHQVYVAAEAGNFDEAQAMMDKVLRDHPKSAKAHFVEAELLVKQARFARAEGELNTAEQLAPGLPFAKPKALQNLRSRIAASHATARSAVVPHQVQAPAPNEMPWGLLFIGVGLVAFIVFAVRFMNRRNVPTYAPSGMAPYRAGPMGQPYASGATGPMMGPAAGGGGMGSGIMGGLATGAAMGAGLVAGEALMHHFTDGNRSSPLSEPPPARNDGNVPDDMGGSDFGIADNSSWDDGSSSDDGASGGGDDWG